MYLEVCGDGVDNDDDGLADCVDPDCAPGCLEDCTDGVDNDLDYDADCDDPQCTPLCQERCYDGVDHDGDHLVGCADPDCAGRCAERCQNGGDDDLDGRIDCADSACSCAEVCDNGLDDDRNGATDCADAACGNACGEVCGNGADDDADGLVDCEDGSCTDACVESCSNGVDDDGDLWTDCQDEECWEDPACPPADHVAWVVDGYLDTNREVDSFPYPCGSVVVDSGRGRAFAVRGLVHVDHAGREGVCGWTVESAFFTHWIVRGFDEVTCATYQRTTASVYRRSFAVEQGCGLNDSGFLPGDLRSRENRYLSTSSASLPDGTPWYGAADGVRMGWLTTPTLAAAGVYGQCATGQPTRVRAPHLVGGVFGFCSP